MNAPAAPRLDPAVATALAHERRRRATLPPLGDLPVTGDEAIRLIRAEELHRAAERVGYAFDKATRP